MCKSDSVDTDRVQCLWWFIVVRFSVYAVALCVPFARALVPGSGGEEGPAVGVRSGAWS